MKVRSGFSLIEVVIGVAISAILAGSVLFVFNQTQKSAKNIQNMISNDVPILIFQNQFEKDITGVFVPEYWYPDKSASEDKSKSPSPLNKNREPKPEKKEPKVKKIDKTFFSENKDDNLKFLTFITSNPFQSYGTSKPRMARVVYSLEKAPESDYLKLFRQETPELDYSKFDANKVNKFELLTRIKDFKVKYFYFPNKQEPKNKKSPDKSSDSAKSGVYPELDSGSDKSKDRPYYAEASKDRQELKDLPDWNYPRKKDEAKLPKIPQYVTINLTLYEADLKKDNEYEFKYVIYGQPIIKNKKDKETTDKEQPKSEPGNAVMASLQGKENVASGAVQKNPNLNFRRV